MSSNSFIKTKHIHYQPITNQFKSLNIIMTDLSLFGIIFAA
ncbi:hypothetical protein FM120_04970 [Sphingobacterium faecium PCAi_F2.5]|nr:hypothetical protein FM120_04970 [Sphingobacterium faecium PCAi_F2.5]